MTILQVDAFVLDGPLKSGGTVLKMAAKRYRKQGCCPDQGVTLLLAHGTGFHKELWEPTLETLFSLRNGRDPPTNVREAWALDWQSHGDSAVLNTSALKARREGLTIADWAHAIVAFLRSPHIAGQRLVAIGHSAGATALMYTTKLLPPEHLPYAGIILVEAPLIDRDVFEKNRKRQQMTIKAVQKAATSRRDVWSSKEQALEWLRSRRPWSTWDARVLALYGEYGMCQAPGAPPGFVSTKCDKMEEANNYGDVENTYEATEQIERVCERVPIHVIFGEHVDMTPRYGQDSMIDESKGRRVASVVRVPDAGHLIVQQKPDALASYLSASLNRIYSPVSRL